MVACLFVCVVAPVSIVAVHIHRNPLFSVVDEAEHYDYVERIAQGSLPRFGQSLLPSTTHLWRCVGHADPGWPPACGPKATVIPARPNGDDDQYEAQQPPLYYMATALMRLPFIHVLGMSSLNGTRLTGALWLAAGLLLLWLAGVVVGLDWWVIAAGVLFLCVSENAIYEASYVSNDAASIFAGGLVAALAAIGWKHPRAISPWLFGLCGFLMMLLKNTACLGVIAATLTLGVGALAEARHVPGGLRTWAGWRRWFSIWWPAGGALLLGTAIGLIAWSVTFQALSLVTPRKLPAIILLGIDRGKPGWSELSGAALAMLDPLSGPSVGGEYYRTGYYHVRGSAFSQNLQQLTAEFMWLLPIGAGLSFLFARTRRWAHWLGLISLPVLWLGGWALGISILEEYGYYTVLPGRYGLSVAPLLILAVVGAFEGRWPTRMMWAVSLLFFGLTFFYMYA